MAGLPGDGAYLGSPPKRYRGGVAQPDPEQDAPDVTASESDAGVQSPAAGGGTYRDADEALAEGADDFEELELEDEDQDEGRETIDEFGRRHVRRAAPEGTEQILENEIPRRTGLPDAIERWRMRSATGTVLTAVAFGLQQVFEAERKDPAIVMQTSGEPPKDLPVQAQLEQLGPRQSSVVVRPWLLAGNTDPGTVEPEIAEPGAEDDPQAARGEAGTE